MGGVDRVAGMADAVVVPGGRFGPAAGLLLYAGSVADRRGATVHRHSWSREPMDPFEREVEGWVCAELAGQVVPLDLDAGGKLLASGA
jgi:hypothetical protein